MAVLATVAQSPAQGDPNGTDSKAAKVVFTERISDVQLRKLQADDKLRKSAEKSPTGNGGPQAGPSTGSFEEASDFIAFNGFCTFVPKGAILHIPERYRNCIVGKPVGQLVLWRAFLAKNPAWIAPLEVTLKEASGTPIGAERLKSALHSDKVIITVTRGNPTSVAKRDETAKK